MLLWMDGYQKSKYKVNKEDVFSKDLYFSIESKYDKKSLRNFRALTQKYFIVVKESRQGNIYFGKQIFEEIESYVDLFEDEFMYKLSRVFGIPARAYINYKLEDYKAAYEDLFYVLKIDEEFEQGGIKILNLHRIQQLQNIARIHFHLKKMDDWKTLMIQSIEYILFGLALPELYGKYSKKDLYEVPSALRFSLVLQLINEFILFNAITNSEWSIKDFRFDEKKIVRFNQEEKDLLYLIQWFKAKKQVSYKNYNSFFNHSLNIFQGASAKLDLLKYSLLRDLKAIEPEKENNANRFIEKLHIPFLLRQPLQNS